MIGKDIKEQWHLLHVFSNCDAKLYFAILNTNRKEKLLRAIREIFFNIGHLNFEIPDAVVKKLKKNHRFISLLLGDRNQLENIVRKHKSLIQVGLTCALRYLTEEKESKNQK